MDEFYGGTASRLAKKMDVAPSVVTSLLPEGRSNNPSYDVLVKLIRAHPELRVEWIVCGVEPIYNRQHQPGYADSEALVLEVKMDTAQLHRLWSAMKALDAGNG